MIVGQLLKFTKGSFLAGQDNKKVPNGTQLIANMDELLAAGCGGRITNLSNTRWEGFQKASKRYRAKNLAHSTVSNGKMA